MFKRKKQEKRESIKLTEDEYMYLDLVMLALRHSGKQSENLKQILLPIAALLFDNHYLDHAPPQGAIKVMDSGKKPNSNAIELFADKELVKRITGGRLH